MRPEKRWVSLHCNLFLSASTPGSNLRNVMSIIITALPNLQRLRWFCRPRLSPSLFGHYPFPCSLNPTCDLLNIEVISKLELRRSVAPLGFPPALAWECHRYCRISKCNVVRARSTRFRVQRSLRLINAQNPLGSLQHMVVSHYSQIVITRI